MPLGPRQLQALETLEWLHDPRARGEGRTFALAVALIRQACRYPGVSIQIFDHTNTGPSRRQLQEYIQDLVQSDHRLVPRAIITERVLSIPLPQPILDWLPPETYFQTMEARTRGRAAGRRLNRTFGREHEDVTDPGDPRERNLRGLLALNDEVSQRMRQLGLSPSTEALDPAVPTDTISQEAVDRLGLEERARQELAADLARADTEPRPVFGIHNKNKGRPAVKKPEPKSAWDRLLADDED